MWALPLASVLFLQVGAGEGGWRVCGVPGAMVAARGTAAGGLRESGWERGVAGGAEQGVGLLRLRGGRKKGEVEGESGSVSDKGSSDDDPMKNEPPPDRIRFTGGVSTLLCSQLFNKLCDLSPQCRQLSQQSLEEMPPGGGVLISRICTGGYVRRHE